MCNHSNTHDSFITAEVLAGIGVPSTMMVGEEGLSLFELGLFKSCRTTIINRSDKQSANNGLYDIAGKLIHVLFSQRAHGIFIHINLC